MCNKLANLQMKFCPRLSPEEYTRYTKRSTKTSENYRSLFQMHFLAHLTVAWTIQACSNDSSIEQPWHLLLRAETVVSAEQTPDGGSVHDMRKILRTIVTRMLSVNASLPNPYVVILYPKAWRPIPNTMCLDTLEVQHTRKTACGYATSVNV